MLFGGFVPLLRGGGEVRWAEEKRLKRRTVWDWYGFVPCFRGPDAGQYNTIGDGVGGPTEARLSDRGTSAF